MLKEFLVRQMVRSQMKGVPEAEQEKLISAISKNPELFQAIATEVQEKMKSGKDQVSALLEVLGAHKEELQKVLGK